MLAVVKRPHTKKPLFKIFGDVSPNHLDFIKQEYGDKSVNIELDDDEYIALVCS